MANIPLSSIKFPGLSDTYTIPQIDDTLNVTGEAADAKAAGDAISDIKEDLSTTKNLLTDINGIVVPEMELGSIGFSSSAISFNTSTNTIRTPSTGGIRVTNGDIVHLTNYSIAKFNYAILKDSDSKYTYGSAYRTTDFTVPNDGILYLVVQKSDSSVVTDVVALTQYVRIIKTSGYLYDVDREIDALNLYDFILENNKFTTNLFGVGTYGDGNYNPTFRPYRVSTIRTLTLGYNVTITAKSGYRFGTFEYINNAWVGSTWITSATITAGTPFGLLLAKTTEDSSSTADVAEFLDNYIITTNFGQQSDTTDVDEDAISEYMARFYESEESEAYAFFTDPHLMGRNGEFNEIDFSSYISFLKKNVEQTSACYVMCGGDWLNSGDTKEEASVKLGYVAGRMAAEFPEKYYPIVGNHDFNYLGVDSEGTRLSESNWVDNSAMRNFFFSKFENCYYKFKKSIAMNYVLNTRTDHDGTNTYDKTMLDWLAGELIADNPEHATLMFHIYYLSSVGTTIPTRVVAIGKIIEAFNNHTTCILTSATEGYDKTYDFTGTTGHIDYSIVGHTHADFSSTLGGVPVIGCINFTNGSAPSFDLILADYMNGKLYTTRVGTGSSRSFNI